MALKRILTIVFSVLVLSVYGQTQTGMVGDLTVRSQPQGAQVILTGEAVVSGVTPARFSHLLIGDYELTLKKHGYETYTTRVILDPGKATEIDVTLSAKTRFKAAARSLFVPGWGQRYADQKTRGFVFTLLAVGSVAAYLIVDNDFDDKREYFNDLTGRYDSLSVAGNIGELRRLYPRLAEAQEETYDAEDIRRITIGTVIGVWGLSLVDAVFFFPEERAAFSVKGLSVKPSTDLSRVGLTISLTF